MRELKAFKRRYLKFYRCFNRFQMKWPVWRWSWWIVWPLQGPEPQQESGVTPGVALYLNRF